MYIAKTRDDNIRIIIQERDSNPKNIYEKKFTLNE